MDFVREFNTVISHRLCILTCVLDLRSSMKLPLRVSKFRDKSKAKLERLSSELHKLHALIHDRLNASSLNGKPKLSFKNTATDCHLLLYRTSVNSMLGLSEKARCTTWTHCPVIAIRGRNAFQGTAFSSIRVIIRHHFSR